MVAIAALRFLITAKNISEDLKPTDEVDVGIVGGTKLVLRDADSRESPLALTRGQQAYLTSLSGAGRTRRGEIGLCSRPVALSSGIAISSLRILPVSVPDNVVGSGGSP